MLVRGTIATYQAGDDDNPFVVTTEGAVLGAMSLVISKPRPVTIKAIDSVETLFVPRAAFLKLCQQSPELAARAADRIRGELMDYLGAIETMRGRIGVVQGLTPNPQKCAMTGTWSDGFSLQPRAGLMISAAVECAAISAVAQMWSRRRPRSEVSQSWAR